MTSEDYGTLAQFISARRTVLGLANSVSTEMLASSDIPFQSLKIANSKVTEALLLICEANELYNRALTYKDDIAA